MTALVLIGFFFLVAVALYLTVAAFGAALGEFGFTGSVSPISGVLFCIAGVIWALCYWMWPFHISIGLAA